MPDYKLYPRLFECEMAIRNDLIDTQETEEIYARLRNFDTSLANLTPSEQPVALRWRVHQLLGIPREPFLIWRRQENDRDLFRSSIAPDINITGETILEWGRQPMVEVIFVITPSSGNVIIQALDDHTDPIPGVQVETAVSRIIRLSTMNICAVRIEGNAQIINIEGVPTKEYINADGWELTETVGLPLAVGEADLPVYDPILQGRPSNPKPGVDAAFDRLVIGNILHIDPPASPIGLVPWPVPPPGDILNELRDLPDSALKMTLEMLTDLPPAIFESPDGEYGKELSMPGATQPGITPPHPPPSGTATVRVAGLTLLSAATDNWTALGFGFGTTDFAPAIEVGSDDFLEPTGQPRPIFDYRVTIGYQLTSDIRQDFAALAGLSRFSTQTPENFKAQKLSHRRADPSTVPTNRPVVRDGLASVNIELSWKRLQHGTTPHSYVMAVDDGAGSADILNEPRTPGSLFYLGYVPAQRPVDSNRVFLDPSEEDLVTFSGLLRPAPFFGDRSEEYVSAALDVFGRWSNWASNDVKIDADIPKAPMILDISANMDEENQVDRKIPAEFVVEVAWDWADRSPKKIRLFGEFFPANASTIPSSIPTDFQRSQVDSTGVEITFTGDLPSLPPSIGEVEILPIRPTDGETRRYKVTIKNCELDFQISSAHKYVAYASASEVIREPFIADWFPTLSTPKVTTFADPLPADVPSLSPDIRWTAIPDATGIARATLSFPAVPHAAGYVIYQANEAALWGLNDQQPSGNDLVTRASELLPIATSNAARDAFTRVNRELLPEPKVELSLPESLEGMYIYQVATVTEQGKESEQRSGVVFIAVPTRITPAPPEIRGRVEDGNILIRAIPAPNKPVGSIEIHRARSDVLSTDIDLMGPPEAVFDPSDPAWSLADGVFTWRDTVSPSWHPYIYRLVALGPNLPNDGILPGRSVASAKIDMLHPPPDPPDLTPLGRHATGSLDLLSIQFRSLADIRQSPLGSHRLKIITRVLGENRYTQQATEILPDIGEILSPPDEVPHVIHRGERDSDNRWLYEIFVPQIEGDDTYDEIIVQLTDPLGRMSEERTAFEIPFPDPPDLVDLRARSFFCLLTVSVSSNAPFDPPPTGTLPYVLNLYDITDTKTLLVGQQLHLINDTSGGFGTFRRRGPNASGRYTYSTTLVSLGGRVRRVMVQLTSPEGLTTELRRDV